MKKLNLKEILVPAVALLVFCLVATAILAGTNMITAAKIADNAVQTETQSRQKVLPAGVTYTEVSTADTGVTWCAGLDADGNTVGYVYTAGAKGYGGTVSVMVGIDTEGAITGIEILSHSETPGLGANATKDSFKDRFIGKSGILTVNKNSNDGQNVQAITAATITSNAVVSAVNLITVTHSQINGGENNG